MVLNGKWMFETLHSCKYFKHINDSLTIFNLTEEDVGNVTCVVDTELGKPLKLTHLIEKEQEVQWLFIWIGVISAIIILLIILIVLVIRCRRRHRTWSPVPAPTPYPKHKKGEKVKTNSNLVINR